MHLYGRFCRSHRWRLQSFVIKSEFSCISKVKWFVQKRRYYLDDNSNINGWYFSFNLYTLMLKDCLIYNVYFQKKSIRLVWIIDPVTVGLFPLGLDLMWIWMDSKSRILKFILLDMDYESFTNINQFQLMITLGWEETH